MELEDQEVVKAIQEIHTNVAQIKTSLFGMPDTDDKGFVGRTNDSLKSHGVRIGSLERYRYQLAGGIVLAVFLLELAAKALFR